MSSQANSYIGKMLKDLSENIREIGKRQQGIRDDVVKIKDELHERMDELKSQIENHEGRLKNIEEFRSEFKDVAKRVVDGQQKLEIRIAYYLGASVAIIAVIQLFKSKLFGV